MYLKRGSTELTIENIRREFVKSPEFDSGCARGYYKSFEEFVNTNLGSLKETGIIRVTKGTIFWAHWLKDKIEVQEWLVKHHFAEWNEEIVYSLDGKEGTEKLELKDMGNGEIRVLVGEMSYNLVGFKNGKMCRFTSVPSDLAQLDKSTCGQIKEVKESEITGT